MRRSVLILFFIYCSFVLYAQKGITLTGTVLDKLNNQPLEFASIELLKLPDSSILSSDVTDNKGKFAFKNITEGLFLLRYSFIGYDHLYQQVTAANTNIALKPALLMSLSADMSEVTVTATKPLMTVGIDRKIYNVGQDLMSQSGSISDILKNIPSIEVDLDGGISLRGGNALILINGRPSALLGSNAAEVLQQLPANSIERVEIITNPSAKFRPDGSSGIINIVLKKNIKSGFNGIVTAGAGNRDRYNGSFNINYRKDKWNLYGNYGIRKDNRRRWNTNDRVLFNSMGRPIGYFNDLGFTKFRSVSHFFSLGADYQVNEKNTFGLQANGVNRRMTRNGKTERFSYDENRFPSTKFNRLLTGNETEKENEFTLSWIKQFKKEDEQLEVELNASYDDETEDNRNVNQYYFPNSFFLKDNTFFTPQDDQQQITIDYTKPLGEDAQLETGYAGYFIQQDFNFYGEYYDTAAQKFVKDIQRSNQFLYKDWNHAFYATFEKSFEKFGFNVGLRAETVKLQGRLITKDSLIANNYFKLFPTLHLSYELENGELQLNYSKRINRPEGDELNPFPEYQDPLNLSAGNPKLLPEIIHSVQAGYHWQNDWLSFVPSIYYRYKVNGFTSVTIPLNDSVLLNTTQNLSKDQSTGLELIFSAKRDIITANASANFFYNKIDATELGYTNDRSVLSLSMNLNSTIAITKTTLLQVSSNYRSARLTPQGKQFPSFVFNSGLRQDLFKKKLSFTLTASDIFKSQRFRTELDAPLLKQTIIGTRDAPVFYLSFSYRFGTPIKKAEEKIQFEEGL